jgi:hypothetical protein
MTSPGGKLNSPVVPPNLKSKKAEEPTYLSTNIYLTLDNISTIVQYLLVIRNSVLNSVNEAHSSSIFLIFFTKMRDI